MGHLLVFVVLESKDRVVADVDDAFRLYRDSVAGNEEEIQVEYYRIGGFAEFLRKKGVEMSETLGSGVPICRASDLPETVVPNAVLRPDGSFQFYGWSLTGTELADAIEGIRLLRSADRELYIVPVDVKS